MTSPATAHIQPLSHRLAKRLGGLPRVLRRKPLFTLCRHLRYRGIAPTQPSAENREALAALERDGFVLLEGLFDKAQIEAMAQSIEGDLEAVRAGTYEGPGRYHAFSDYGVYKLLDVDKLAPVTAPFYENERIADLARAFVHGKARSYQKMAELRADVGVVNTADIPHFDDWKHRFKAFLYLNDVGEENAPFVYYKGTHRQGPWRLQREYEMFRDGPNGTFGHYFPHEMDAITKAHGIERVVCAAPAGTVVITDTRGIHSGSVLRSGRRLLLANFFTF